jgi:hypothetical protein
VRESKIKKIKNKKWEKKRELREKENLKNKMGEEEGE